MEIQLLRVCLISMVFLVSCKKEPMISGEPVSHWVDQIEDLSLDAKNKALENLRYADRESLQPQRAKLRKIAATRNATSSWIAADLLFETFGEGIPTFRGLTARIRWRGQGAGGDGRKRMQREAG